MTIPGLVARDAWLRVAPAVLADMDRLIQAIRTALSSIDGGTP